MAPNLSTSMSPRRARRAADPLVGGAEVERAVEGVGAVAEHGEGVAEDLPVAAVAGEKDDRAAVHEGAHGFLDVAEFNDVGPGVLGEEAGGDGELDGQDGQVLVGVEARASGARRGRGGAWRW
jgi:hypothetical protein